MDASAALVLYDAYGRPTAPQAVRRPSGAILVDGAHVADTVQCVHCGGHFVMQKGSGVIRGWCHACGGIFCGPGCVPCLPRERALDLRDGG